MGKKILLLRSDVGLAGPARLMQGVARGLRAQGCTVTFATGGGEVAPEIEAEGFAHHDVYGLQIADRSVWSLIRAVWQVRKLARAHDIDVLHSFNAHSGFVGWLAALGTRRKVVNTVLGNGKERMLARMPFPIIAVSQSVKDKLLTFGIPAEKISIVYNSTLLAHQVLPERSDFDALWAERDKNPRFVFGSIAVFTGGKGQIEIAQSFLRFTQKYPDLDAGLLFVGEGPARAEVEAFLAEHGLADRAEFVGRTANVFQYLDRCHGFVHLARMETFGLVLAEASARGLPAVAGNVGGIPEVILDGESGTLVPQNDPEAVADAMAELVRDRDLAKTYGWAGAQRSARLFMADQIGENLVKIYDAL